MCVDFVFQIFLRYYWGYEPVKKVFIFGHMVLGFISLRNFSITLRIFPVIDGFIAFKEKVITVIGDFDIEGWNGYVDHV